MKLIVNKHPEAIKLNPYESNLLSMANDSLANIEYPHDMVFNTIYYLDNNMRKYGEITYLDIRCTCTLAYSSTKKCLYLVDDLGQDIYLTGKPIHQNRINRILKNWHTSSVEQHAVSDRLAYIKSAIDFVCNKLGITHQCYITNVCGYSEIHKDYCTVVIDHKTLLVHSVQYLNPMVRYVSLSNCDECIENLFNVRDTLQKTSIIVTHALNEFTQLDEQQYIAHKQYYED